MPTYMVIPQNKLTLGSTAYENLPLTAEVIRVENGFDSATIVLPDTTYYPGTVTESTAVKLEVKEAGGSYTTIFKGVARFVVADITSESRTLTLSCLGTGYGLGEMLVANEYGSQSINGDLNLIAEILTDATDGVLNGYVNKVLASATDSGFAYTSTIENSLNNDIPYIMFPYKPALQAINDLVDVYTAAQAGAAGVHWIVTTDDTFRLKTVGATTDVAWTKYYGGSQANATLVYGTDYTKINLEKTSSEANYVVYYGNWRRPSNGDYWTESAAALWGKDNVNDVLSDDASVKMVNANSTLFTVGHAPANHEMTYPAAEDMALDLSVFTLFNIPSINFYLRHSSGVTDIVLRLKESDTEYYYVSLSLPAADTWQHYTFPLGTYYKQSDASLTWSEVLTPQWSNINAVEFYFNGGMGDTLNIDGLYIGDAPICRVAFNSDLPGNVAKMRLIVDDVGKDDSLLETDDSGLMAQLAYAELLRLQATPTVGYVETPMLKDALPGQLLYIQSTDYRVTKIKHNITSNEYTSLFTVTTDVLNGRSRSRYEDLNKQWANIRPEWQDRQASNIKAGKVDYRISRFETDYAPP